MGKLSIFFLIIITLYFIYSFIKSISRKGIKKISETKKPEDKEEATNRFRYIIVAVIAVMMEDRRYRIKSVLSTGEKEQRYSLWKIFGRQENMMRRMFFNRK